MVGRVFGYEGVSLVIAADTADVNVFTLAGSPAGAVDVTVTINSGVVVYQNAGSAALRTGSVPAGSKITLINRGYVVGKGGSANAGAGGDAVLREAGELRIDNGSGFIFGGGGGGGFGSSEGNVSPALNGAGGGGGGGGRGRVSSSGGTGSANYAVPGSSGSGGDFTAAGGGGGGGSNNVYGNFGGAGGQGGGWGENGSQGDYGQPSFIYGQAGGAAGYAIRNGGANLVWISGYSSERVKGTVA